MTQPDPAKIARGLTEAQKRALRHIGNPAFFGDWVSCLSFDMTGATWASLANRLLIRIGGERLFKIAPLGLAVLAALDAETRHDR